MELEIPRIFISYSSLDKKLAKQLLDWLLDQGFSIWFDIYELVPGVDITEEIRKGINSSDYVVLLLTRNSISSQWVKKEIKITLTDEIQKNKSKLIPLLAAPLGKKELPLEIREKKYIKIQENSNDFENIIPGLFPNNFTITMTLTDNYELDIELTKENVLEYFRLFSDKPLLIRINNNNFTKEYVRICKRYVDIELEEKGLKDKIAYEIDTLQIDLTIFWSNMSCVFSRVLNAIIEDLGNNMRVIMTCISNIFSLSMIYLYGEISELYVDGISYEIVSQNIEDTDLKGINNFLKRYENLENNNPKYVQNLIRSFDDTPFNKYKEWKKFEIVTKDEKQRETFFYYKNISDEDYLFSFGETLTFLITTEKWYTSCLPQIISYYIKDCFLSHKRIYQQYPDLKIKMSDYETIFLA